MSHSLPPLQWLRAFEAAARHTSFSAAARELNMTPAAISYQVRNLEEYFGVALFERLARGLNLTEIGQAYLPSVIKAFSDLSASSVGMFGGVGKSSLTIRVTLSFGALWLSPRLTDFLNKYPDINVQIHSSLWIDSVGQQECDLEIRYGAGNWEGSQSEMLINEEILLVGSPDLTNSPETIEDLLDQPLIHIMGVEDSWDKLFNREGFKISPKKRRLKVDTSLIAMEMATTGAGYALIFKSFVQQYIDAGKLHVPLEVDLSTEQSHHLIYPKEKHKLRPEVHLFRDWLFEQVKQSD